MGSEKRMFSASFWKEKNARLCVVPLRIESFQHATHLAAGFEAAVVHLDYCVCHSHASQSNNTLVFSRWNEGLERRKTK